MSQQHETFGSFDVGALHETDVVWERSLDIGGHTAEAALWANPGEPIDPALLDDLAALLARTDALDAIVRAALLTHLHRVDASVPAGSGSAGPDEDAARAADETVAGMHCVRLALLPDAEAPVLLDYAFGDDADDFLAVTCDRDGTVLDVARVD